MPSLGGAPRTPRDDRSHMTCRSLGICMYVCMYVRMYVCTYVRTYVRAYVRACVRMCVSGDAQAAEDPAGARRGGTCGTRMI